MDNSSGNIIVFTIESCVIRALHFSKKTLGLCPEILEDVSRYICQSLLSCQESGLNLFLIQSHKIHRKDSEYHNSTNNQPLTYPPISFSSFFYLNFFTSGHFLPSNNKYSVKMGCHSHFACQHSLTQKTGYTTL